MCVGLSHGGLGIEWILGKSVTEDITLSTFVAWSYVLVGLWRAHGTDMHREVVLSICCVCDVLGVSP